MNCLALKIVVNCYQSVFVKSSKNIICMELLNVLQMFLYDVSKFQHC